MLPPKHCNINLTGPIPRWDEAIPLGNGILGSLFWGPMEHLRISVDIAGPVSYTHLTLPTNSRV